MMSLSSSFFLLFLLIQIMSQLDLRKRMVVEELADAFFKLAPEVTAQAPTMSDAGMLVICCCELWLLTTSPSTQAFRTAVWTRVERAMTKLQSQAALVRGLHRVLLKKRSQTTHVNFSDLVDVSGGGSNLCQHLQSLSPFVSAR